MNESLKSDEAIVMTIADLKARAEIAARTAEEASSKANSESGFAYNAKQNAEEHAKAISQVHGTVDAEFAGLMTTKNNLEEMVSGIKASKANTDADVHAIAEAKAVIDKAALSSKTAGDQCVASLSVIEKAQTDVAAALKEVNSGTAAIAQAKTNSDAAFTAIQALQTQSTEVASKASTDGTTIAKIESESKTYQSSLSKIVTEAAEAQKNVNEYEDKLVKLIKDFSELNKKIEGLLPNATSAGLASAFRNQQERFKKPQKNWLYTFVTSIVILLIIGGIGLPSLQANDSWDAILRHLMIRLPLIVPLVWIGIYAGRNYMLALRVEEEYAFKEAVSTSFEGYKREMTEISASGNNETRPLIVLCENVLMTLAQRPGRIYEGRHEDITPLSPVKGFFSKKQTNNTTEKIPT